MDFKHKIRPQSIFQKLGIGLLLAIGGLTIWAGYSAYQLTESMLRSDPAPTRTEGMTSYSSHSFVRFGSTQFTQTANIDTSYTYVTITDATLSPSQSKARDILSAATEDQPILGLSSHPSFFVKESHRPFWITQIYLELGLLISGFLAFIAFFIWVSFLDVDHYQKLFTKQVYHRLVGLFSIFFVGFIVDAFLSIRKINFLNTEFNFVEPPTNGISLVMLFVLILLSVLIIFLRRGIPIQNEQDLTV